MLWIISYNFSLKSSYFSSLKGGENMNIKKIIVGATASAIIFGTMVVPALAAAGDNAAPCGATHGAFAVTNGNFGWLGPLGGTPGYHGAVGQDPGATGYNNSSTDCQSH